MLPFMPSPAPKDLSASIIDAGPLLGFPAARPSPVSEPRMSSLVFAMHLLAEPVLVGEIRRAHAEGRPWVMTSATGLLTVRMTADGERLVIHNGRCADLEVALPQGHA